MRKLLVSVFLLVGAVFGAAGIATAGQPLPPVHPPQLPPIKLVLKGVLSNYVAPTATTNGSVAVTVTSLRGTSRLVAKHTVVLTPQTVIKGTVANGQFAVVQAQRVLSLSGPQPLVALKLVAFAQATPVNPDPPFDLGSLGSLLGPSLSTDDGNLACGEEECAAP